MPERESLVNTENACDDTEQLTLFARTIMPRTVYVDITTPPETVARLTESGYHVIDLLAMTRDTPDEHRACIRARAQAIAEGTITATDDQRRALELEARSWGMLAARSESTQVRVLATADELGALLGWGSSRHTLAGNSTSLAAAETPPKRLT